MPSVPDAPRITCHSGLQDVPPAFAALFGPRLFDSLSWYSAVCAAGLPASAEALFVTVSAGARPLALLPMRRDVTRMSSLTTPLTGLWRPLTAPGLTSAELHDIAQAFGRWCRSWAKVRLEALDVQDPAWTVLLGGFREAGIRALPFQHFGSWTAFAGLGWESYIASRPAPLRDALESHGARFLAQGASLRVVTGGADLSQAIEALARAGPAPGLPPAFTASLLRSFAGEGWLRLGLLEQAGRILAAQLWVVQGGGATLLQPGHDAGPLVTVLTGWMIRHLLEQDGVATLDFGRGDGEYERAWAGLRRQRDGLILANPWRPMGLAAVLHRRLRGAAPDATQTRFQRRRSD